MTSSSEHQIPSVAPRAPAYPLRLCRGWVAGCTDQPGITFTHRRRLSDCCVNGERAWLIADETMSFLGAFFDLGIARHIRDATTRHAALLQVDTLLARCSEEQPTRVEIGLFHGEEFEHLIVLDRTTALQLLLSLVESLEASMKADPTSSRGLKARYDAPANPFAERSAPHEPGSVSEPHPPGWRTRHSEVVTHRMLRQLHRLASRTRRIEQTVRVSLTRLELLFSDQCYGHSAELFMIHLLADARHFCDAHALSMAVLDRRAHAIYLEQRFGNDARDVSTESAAPPALHIPPAAWKDVSDGPDRSILMATVTIGGVSHHLKAIEVTRQHTVQCAVDPVAEEELAELHASCGASGPFETVTLEDREYVLTLTPHAR